MNLWYVWTYIASMVWAIGVVVLLAYAAISYFRLCRVVREPAPLWDNIYLCDHIQTSFVLGIFRPRVYQEGVTFQADIIIMTHSNASEVIRLRRQFSFLEVTAHAQKNHFRNHHCHRRCSARWYRTQIKNWRWKNIGEFTICRSE